MTSSLTLQPNETDGKDAILISDVATTNFGASGVIDIGEQNPGTTIRRGVIQFDLSGIPAGSTILTATLSLYCTVDYSSNARTMRAFRLKRAWVESEVTWNIYSSGNSWQTAGGFGTDDCEQTDIGSRAFSASETLNQFKDIALTASAVQEWLDGAFANNGLLLKMDTESNDGYRFLSSSDGTAANRPKLVITYQLKQSAAGALAPAGAETHLTGKPVAGTLTSGAALTVRTAKALAGALTASATLARQVSTAVAGSLTSAGALARQAGKAVAGELAAAGTQARVTLKALAGALASSGSQARLVLKALAGALGLAGNVAGQSSRVPGPGTRSLRRAAARRAAVSAALAAAAAAARANAVSVPPPPASAAARHDPEVEG